jgi:hypothetical protein
MTETHHLGASSLVVAEWRDAKLHETVPHDCTIEVRFKDGTTAVIKVFEDGAEVISGVIPNSTATHWRHLAT